jgi:transcriptional regulator with XRE-family HTH domain
MGKKDKPKRTLWQRMVDRRRELGLTQSQLALLSHVPQSEISRIERGTANPTYNTLRLLAEALQADLKLSIRKD